MPALRTLRRTLVPSLALAGVAAAGIALSVGSAASNSHPRTVVDGHKPVLSSPVVDAGGSVRVSGLGCFPNGSDDTEVEATLGTRWNDIAFGSSRPTRWGGWTMLLDVPASTRPGTYAVIATCDQYDAFFSYPSVSVTVRSVTHLSMGPGDDVTFGEPTTITGRVLDGARHARPHAPVLLQQRTGPHAPFRTVRIVQSSGSGELRARIVPDEITTYRWAMLAAHGADAVTSPSATVSVDYRVTLQSVSQRDGRHRSVLLFGTITPADFGHRVWLQQRGRHGWTTWRTTTVHRVSVPGRGHLPGYLFDLGSAPRGSYQLRVVATGDDDYSAGTSATRFVTVR